MALPPFLNSIVGWLRAGYPQGVPDHDYVALLALLSRRLTADEVSAVAAELVRQVGTINGTAGPGPDHDGEQDFLGGPETHRASAEDGQAPVNGSGHSQVAVDSIDIGVLITKITNELPREEDVARVRAHLEAAGPFL